MSTERKTSPDSSYNWDVFASETEGLTEMIIDGNEDYLIIKEYFQIKKAEKRAFTNEQVEDSQKRLEEFRTKISNLDDDKIDIELVPFFLKVRDNFK